MWSFPAAVCMILFCGCGSYRGIPSHGGGKRFSEEQRIVAGAVRQSVSKMRLEELKGKRIRVVYTSMPTSGAANINWGGIQGISLGASIKEDGSDLYRHLVPGTYETKDNWENRQNGSLSYRPDASYYVQKVTTDGDLNYLRAALMMRAHHEGITVSEEKPEVILHVLVDILGTNRSRQDWVLMQSDRLTATCELSYYARDLQKHNLLFGCRRSGANVTYLERKFGPLPIPSMVSYENEALVSADRPWEFDHGDFVNGGILPESSSGGNPADPDKEKEEYLRSLTNQARALLENRQDTKAQEVIKTIRTVDPSWEELSNLEEKLKESEEDSR